MEAVDFQILKGAPSAEEIAALAAAIAQIQANSMSLSSAFRQTRSKWGTPRLRQLKRVHSGWRRTLE